MIGTKLTKHPSWTSLGALLREVPTAMTFFVSDIRFTGRPAVSLVSFPSYRNVLRLWVQILDRWVRVLDVRYRGYKRRTFL